jgi:large subunit ribosomal protein L31
MKNIHPKFYEKAEVVCACGNRFYIGSTKPSIKIEICSACHPYFTKKDKFIDKAGRVDRYKARLERYTKITEEKEKRKKEKERKRKEAELLLRSRKR